MCTKSHGKSEVELSYQCEIHNLVTCEFMSLDMLIKTQTISPSIRDFVLKKDRDRCPLNTSQTLKCHSRELVLFVVGLYILFLIYQVLHLFEASWHLLIIQAEFSFSVNGTLHSGAMSNRSLDWGTNVSVERSLLSV